MMHRSRTAMMNAISEGMDVYDRENDKIGTVDEVFYGSEDVDSPEIEVTTADTHRDEPNELMALIRDALATGDKVPEELRARMERLGYIRIDTGFLSSDRLALTSQLASVTDDGVYLAVDGDELIKD